MKVDPSTREVTVCGACLTASCWHGEFMCEKSRTAKTVQRSVAELRALNREHPQNYSVRRVREACGEQDVEGFEQFEGTDEDRDV